LEVLNAITDAANTRGVAVEHPPVDVCTCSTTRSASIKQALVAAVTKCHTSVIPKAITVSPHNDCVSAKGGPLERNLQAGIVLAAYALFLGGCAADPESETGETPPPSEEHEVFRTDLGKAEILTDNLEAPWSVAFFHETALISERDAARILEMTDDGTTREVGVVEQAESEEGEGGLLGIALYENQLYTYLTTDSDNRIIRYDLAGEPGSLELTSPKEVFTGIPAAGYHNGGRIAFGPDGMLYVTTGDALEPSQSQDLESLAGKTLRLTPDGDIPADNPFDDSPVYSYGHRNVQGLAWAEDGTLYASEFGENEWDELNVIEAGGNYGWPEHEGPGGEPEYIDPVQQWAPAEESPSAIEIHNDTIYMAALRGQRLWEIPLEEIGTSTDYLVQEFGRLREVTTAPDGSLWILTNNTDGVGEPDENDDLLLRIEL